MELFLFPNIVLLTLNFLFVFCVDGSGVHQSFCSCQLPRSRPTFSCKQDLSPFLSDLCFFEHRSLTAQATSDRKTISFLRISSLYLFPISNFWSVGICFLNLTLLRQMKFTFQRSDTLLLACLLIEALWSLRRDCFSERFQTINLCASLQEPLRKRNKNRNAIAVSGVSWKME